MLHRLFGGFFLCMLCTPLLASAVGSTAGQFTVTGMGAASYRIPLDLPSGTAGMQPDLALEYNSQGAYGPMGLGWSISGAQSITHCPSTIAQDGVNKPIQLTTIENLCLGGSRLVVVSGEYGETGSEYRTELASFTKVVQLISNGSPYFEAYSKDGLIYTFGSNDAVVGSTSNATTLISGTRQKALTVFTVAWPQSRITDRHGNYISFSYKQTGNRQRISKIEYSGNDPQGLAPYYKVVFEYQTPSVDTLRFFPLGEGLEASLKSPRTLKKIKVLHTPSNQTIKQWEMDYSPETDAGRFFLERITECGYVDNQEECLPSTNFGWKGSSYAAFSSGESQSISFGDGKKELHDVNNDGFLDIISFQDYRVAVYLNDGAGGYQEVYQPSSSGAHYFGNHHVLFAVSIFQTTWEYPTYSRHISDINSDGVPDLVGFGQDGVVVALGNTDGTFQTEHTATSSFGRVHGWDRRVHPRFVQDADNNGIADLIVMSSNGVMVALGDGDGFFGPATTWLDDFGTGHGWSSTGGVPRSLVDMNGDNRPDIIGFASDGVYVSLNDQNRFKEKKKWSDHYGSQSGWSDNTPRQFGDVNGDGLPDLIGFSSVGLEVSINAGDEFKSPQNWHNGLGTNDQWSQTAHLRQLADLNHDGLTDVLAIGHAGTTILYSTGETFVSTTIASPGGLDTSNGWNNESSQRFLRDITSDGIVDVVAIGNNQLKYAANLSEYHEISTISNGLGATTHISYQTLPRNLRLTASNSGDLLHKRPSLRVVASHHSDKPGSGATQYSYGPFYIDTQGRGAAGFGWREIMDQQSGSKQRLEFAIEFPFTGLLIRETHYAYNGNITSESHNTYAATSAAELDGGNISRYFPYLERQQTKFYDVDSGIRETTVTKTFEYSPTDKQFGQLTELIVETEGRNNPTHEVTTTSSYHPVDDERWILGRLSFSSVIKALGTVEMAPRQSAYLYDMTSGQLVEETVNPGSSNPNKVTTSYTHDLLGNVITQTVTPYALEDIVTQYEYGSERRFVTKVTNAVNHSEDYSYDAASGLLVEKTGPNGLSMITEYDGLGRVTATISAAGTPKQQRSFIQRKSCAASVCYSSPANSITPSYVVVKTHQDGSAEETAFDKFGREIRQSRTSLGGNWVDILLQHDGKDRLIGKSTPHLRGGAIYWVVNTYDQVGRLIKVDAPIDESNPNGRVVDIHYDGLVTTTTDALGRTSSVTKDPHGNVISATDADNSTITHTYDAAHNVLTTFDALGTPTRFIYDDQGRKIRINDPATGLWTYSYDSLGRLIQQQDAKSNRTQMAYDKLNRMVSRTEPEGKTTWEYDSLWLGSLTLETSPEGYKRQFVYDAYGQPLETIETIDGKNLTSKHEHDNLGRKSALTYPSGLKIGYRYDSYGHLTKICNFDSCGSATGPDGQWYWLAKTQDAWGNIALSQRGNGLQTLNVHDQARGFISDIITSNPNISAAPIQSLSYEWDDSGNLLSREDKEQALIETFEYDSLDRLVASNLNGQSNLSMRYGANGRIDYKSDVGEYIYSNDNPAAVTNTVGLHTANFGYDKNGNQTTGSGRITSWTSFNKPTRIDYIGGLGGGEAPVAEDFTAPAFWPTGSPDNTLELSADVGQQVVVPVGYGSLSIYWTDKGPLVCSAAGCDAETIGHEIQLSRSSNFSLLTKSYYTDGEARGFNFSNIAYGDWYVRVRADTTAGPSDWFEGNTQSVVAPSSETPKPNLSPRMASTEFWYGPNRSRYKQVSVQASDGNADNITTLYAAGGLYQQETSATGLVTEKSFIRVGGLVIAAHTTRSNDTEDIYYLHHDHQGSINAITNQNRAVVDRYSYDAFGKRRSTNWQPEGLGLEYMATGSSINLGYTGHEQLNHLGLIHMNGRLYDPLIGSFLSPDPLVRSMSSPQSFNRYSYVENNPLRYTDPSGYSLKGLFKNKWFRAIITIAAAWATAGIGAAILESLGRTLLTSVLAGAISGAAGGAIVGFAFSGGRLDGALKGAAAGAVAGAITGAIAYTAGDIRSTKFAQQLGDSGKQILHSVTHGIGGGISNRLQNRKFMPGLAAGVLGSFSPAGKAGNIDPGRVARAAFIGGLASSIGGGKFENGAFTAAFLQMYNDGAHPSQARSWAEQFARKAKDALDRSQAAASAAWEGVHGTAGAGIVFDIGVNVPVLGTNFRARLDIISAHYVNEEAVLTSGIQGSMVTGGVGIDYVLYSVETLPYQTPVFRSNDLTGYSFANFNIMGGEMGINGCFIVCLGLSWDPEPLYNHLTSGN